MRELIFRRTLIETDKNVITNMKKLEKGDSFHVPKDAKNQIVLMSRDNAIIRYEDDVSSGLTNTNRSVTSSTGRIDPEIDGMVERGIVEEDLITTAPAPRSRLNTPAVRGQAKAAREAFDRIRGVYARRLGVRTGGQVHHAIELQALDRYPGVFSANELNDFRNMRGIGTELVNRRQLHNSKIREMWDRHYRQLDQDIVQRNLQSGTQPYADYVRRYMESARDEIDNVLGQFFTEYRSSLTWQKTTPFQVPQHLDLARLTNQTSRGLRVLDARSERDDVMSQ